MIPFHHKSDTLGELEDKEDDLEDKGTPINYEFAVKLIPVSYFQDSQSRGCFGKTKHENFYLFCLLPSASCLLNL
jgi:hypothetical protein